MQEFQQSVGLPLEILSPAMLHSTLQNSLLFIQAMLRKICVRREGGNSFEALNSGGDDQHCL